MTHAYTNINTPSRTEQSRTNDPDVRYFEIYIIAPGAKSTNRLRSFLAFPFEANFSTYVRPTSVYPVIASYSMI